MQKVLAVTTYNRLNFLKEMISGFFKHTKNVHEWKLVIADDGSIDGTKEFIESIDFKNTVKIYNNRVGISNQTNAIFLELSKLSDFLCFKSDDDMMFIRDGWDELYLNAINSSGFEHLCFDHYSFNQFGNHKEAAFAEPIVKDCLLARTPSMFVKGCFYTVTDSILKSVGYMDAKSFFHGFEHIDYSMRCARAGFNNIQHIFDAKDSDLYISYRFPISGKDQPSLDKEMYIKNGNSKEEVKVKKEIIANKERVFIDYNFNTNKVISLMPKLL